MTTTIQAGFRTDAVAGTTDASKSKTGGLQITFNGVPDMDAFSVVVGQTVGTTPPAAYTDLSNPSTYPTGELNTLTYRLNDLTSVFQGSATSRPGPGKTVPSAFTAGHYAWICTFDSLAPSGSDAPSAVAGPFLILA